MNNIWNIVLIALAGIFILFGIRSLIKEIIIVYNKVIGMGDAFKPGEYK